MKIIRSIPFILVLAVGIVTAGTAFAHEGHDKEAYAGTGKLVPLTDKVDATWLAKARADYPLTTCSVSGDKLEGGEMGKPQEYIYKETGKPDQFVRFCCKDCVKDFNKEPAKYLKMIEDAEAEKPKSSK